MRIMLIFLQYNPESLRMNQIFYVYFGENIEWDQITFSTFYKRPTFVFILLFFTSIGFFIYSSLADDELLFANDPFRIINNFQIWRYVTAPFAIQPGLIHLFWLVSNFWWLLSLLPQHENKYSSIHLLVQIFFQNFLIQSLYCVIIISLSFTERFQKLYEDQQFVCYGWDPIIILWIFLLTGTKKDSQARLFYLPMKIRNQFLVWVISLWTIAFSKSRLPIIIATVLGAIQFHILYRSFVKLPYKFYLILQKPFLNCSKYFSTFIKLQDVKRNLYPWYHKQFEEIYGKQQYFINTFSQNQTLVQFKGAELDLPKSKIKNQLQIWAKQDIYKPNRNQQGYL